MARNPLADPQLGAARRLPSEATKSFSHRRAMSVEKVAGSHLVPLDLSCLLLRPSFVRRPAPPPPGAATAAAAAAAAAPTRTATAAPPKMVRRIIDADNSCLFNAVGYVLRRKRKVGTELRRMITEAVRERPMEYNEVRRASPLVRCMKTADGNGSLVKFSFPFFVAFVGEGRLCGCAS